MTLTKKLAAVGVALLASSLLLTGAEKADAPKGPTKAVAVLIPTKDSKVSGVITFTKEGDAIHITGKITGLTPGEHGFHVHEFGDLNSDDGMATGGHFDSDKHMHAPRTPRNATPATWATSRRAMTASPPLTKLTRSSR